MDGGSSTRRPLVLDCGGGLGNQMFEYAAALYFKQKFQRPLEVLRPPPHRSQWNGFPRPFQLTKFDIGVSPREPSLKDSLFLSSNAKLKVPQAAAGLILQSGIFAERVPYRLEVDRDDPVPHRTLYMKGNWQAAGYADAVAPALRREFVLREPPQGLNAAYAEQISGLRTPVSLHIRRGDYALIQNASTESANPVSMVLPSSYYLQAVNAVRQCFSDCTLVVFSDEPDHAAAVLHHVDDALYITANDTFSAYEDLRLMSLCKHHIIANSSFSWWGAWLNPNPEKQVFAPRYWSNMRDSFFPDLYPPGWTLIDNMELG